MAFRSRWMTPDDTLSNPGVRGRTLHRNSIIFCAGRCARLAIAIVAALIASCEQTHRVEESSGTRPAASHAEWIERTPSSSSAWLVGRIR